MSGHAPVATSGPRPSTILHVGMGKTGTTTIQAWLRRNRARLLDHGVLVPTSPGRRRHTRLGLAVLPDATHQPLDWRKQQEDSPAELRPVVERELREEIETTGAPRLLLTDEALCGIGEESVADLRRLLTPLTSSVRVVIYLRRQDEHLGSRYQQIVKAGLPVGRLDERAAAAVDTPLYDYAARLRAWHDVFDPDALVVRRFERARFPGGSLLEDFVDAADLGVNLADFTPAPTRNESLDADSVEFLRLLNRLRAEHGDAVADLPRPRDVVRRLGEASDGPVLELSDEARARFLDRWADTNSEVARAYFPDGPDTLFDLSPRGREATSDQRLDPARVDELSEVVELPIAATALLREIAAAETDRA